MKKFIALTVLLLAIAVFFGNYHVVRDKQGLQLVKKSEFGFKETWLDTRDWSPLDYIKHADVSKELAKKHWSDLKRQFESGWDTVTKKFEDVANDIPEDSLVKLQNQAQHKFDELKQRWERQEIDRATLERDLEKVKDWVDERIAELESLNQ
ncbi:MAG: hypothetical protein KDC35_09775 [Acidobacteria bacterium]|nr:hypothetical protein [Acidobacteriota bacterium]